MAKADAAELEAAENLREAQAEATAAQERALQAGQGLVAAKMRRVPEMEVEVLPGEHISHGDKSYYGEGATHAPEGHTGNDTLKLDGPTAISLMQLGHVTIRGAAA